MVEHFQPAGQLLRTAAKQRDDLVGTEKTMPVNEPDDLVVTLRELHGSDRGSAFETGKAGCHRAILLDTKQAGKASRFALGGNFTLMTRYFSCNDLKFFNKIGKTQLS
jgi:hypothetical protein